MYARLSPFIVPSRHLAKTCGTNEWLNVLYTNSGNLRTSLEFKICQLVLIVWRFYNTEIKCVCVCVYTYIFRKSLINTHIYLLHDLHNIFEPPPQKSDLSKTRLVERIYSPWNMFGFVEDSLLNPDPYFMSEELSPRFCEICWWPLGISPLC